MIDQAVAVMNEAIAKIEELREERDRARNEASGLRAVLAEYADMLCEGWCERSYDCAHFEDCGGCLAHRTAQGMSTRSAETEGLSPQDASPVREANAPEPEPEPSQGQSTPSSEQEE